MSFKSSNAKLSVFAIIIAITVSTLDSTINETHRTALKLLGFFQIEFWS
jgi:hypothetical protein